MFRARRERQHFGPSEHAAGQGGVGGAAAGGAVSVFPRQLQLIPAKSTRRWNVLPHTHGPARLKHARPVHAGMRDEPTYNDQRHGCRGVGGRLETGLVLLF